MSADEHALYQDVLSLCTIKHGLKLVLQQRDDLQASVDLFWGLNTDTGRNLYVLAQTSAEQGVFVAFSSVLARAINAHGDILCSSAGHAGNDHRLEQKKRLRSLLLSGRA